MFRIYKLMHTFFTFRLLIVAILTRLEWITVNFTFHVFGIAKRFTFRFRTFIPENKCWWIFVPEWVILRIWYLHPLSLSKSNGSVITQQIITLIGSSGENIVGFWINNFSLFYPWFAKKCEIFQTVKVWKLANSYFRLENFILGP